MGLSIIVLCKDHIYQMGLQSSSPGERERVRERERDQHRIVVILPIEPQFHELMPVDQRFFA